MKIENFVLKQYQDYILKTGDEKTDKEALEAISRHFFAMDTVDKKSFKNVLSAASDLADEFKKKRELVVAFKHDNTEYGFIPDLENITFGEMMDIDAYWGDIANHHKLMAILYRPIIEHKDGKYRILEYDGTEGFDKIMEEMPLNVYFGALRFFGVLGEELQNAFPSYLNP